MLAMAYKKKRDDEKRRKMWLGGEATKLDQATAHPYQKTEYDDFTSAELKQEPHGEPEPDSVSDVADPASDRLKSEPHKEPTVSFFMALKKRRRYGR